MPTIPQTLSLNGNDLEMRGVQPDILIANSFDDKLSGRDSQLDPPIEEVLKLF